MVLNVIVSQLDCLPLLLLPLTQKYSKIILKAFPAALSPHHLLVLLAKETLEFLAMAFGLFPLALELAWSQSFDHIYLLLLLAHVSHGAEHFLLGALRPA